MKLIHLAVKNNKRKHANKTPRMECYWHVCVSRLLKLSRSIQCGVVHEWLIPMSDD